MIHLQEMARQLKSSVNRIKESHPRVAAGLQWVILFLGLFVAIWLATQSRAAPQIILLTMLGVIAANFGIAAGGVLSPVLPIVSVTGLLVAGLLPAVATVAGALLLSELALPFWKPLWEDARLAHHGRQHRLARGLVHVLALVLAVIVNDSPLPGAPALLGGDGTLFDILLLSLTYAGFLFVGFYSLNWLQTRKPMDGDAVVLTLMAAILSQPFAILGAITYWAAGLPAFVIFCVGAGAFAIVSWLAWQRHYFLQQQLDHMSALNTVGASLRATLDLSTLLERTFRQTQTLLDVDEFTIILDYEDDGWQPVFHAVGGRPQPIDESPPVSDCARWVLDHGRTLELNQENMHFASEHNLSPPAGHPAAWMAVPLTGRNGVIGAIVLQRFGSGRRFGSWSQEVIMAVAGHASAAVENARLYGQVVELYNLTDEALTRRLRQLQALLDSTTEAVLMLDTKGRVVLVNPPAARLLGTPREELQGRRLDERRASVALGYGVDALRQLLNDLGKGHIRQRQRTVFEATAGPGNPDGTRWRFVERSGTPVLSAEEQLIGWLFVLRDVTEEQEREQWRTSLTRMIVHDLRNPVTTLISDLDSLELAEERGQSERFQRVVDQARRGCHNMLDMIDSLMDVTRLEAGQVVVDAEAMHVAPLVERILERLRPLARKKECAIILEADAELPPAWADAEILRRVFVNLLDNALKFTPSGGEIRVRLAADEALPRHEPGVRCLVSDSGPGVPPEYRQRIFERFVQVNPGGGQVRGTGLGLTFCKLALEAQGGRIWIEDGPGAGGAFVFTLPGIPHLTAPDERA